MNGIIKRLTDKGFGFIGHVPPDPTKKDVFFHSEALVDVTFDELRVDDAVTFEEQPSEKGPRAVDVRRA